MNFGTIKASQKHKIWCRDRVSQVVGEEETCIEQTRIAAGRQCKLLCVMDMQELKWYAIDNVDIWGLDVAHICEETGIHVLNVVD